MIRNRCSSCGLATRHHRDAKNRTLSCQQARDAHRWATIKFMPLRKLLLRSLEVGR